MTLKEALQLPEVQSVSGGYADMTNSEMFPAVLQALGIDAPNSFKGTMSKEDYNRMKELQNDPKIQKLRNILEGVNQRQYQVAMNKVLEDNSGLRNLDMDKKMSILTGEDFNVAGSKKNEGERVFKRGDDLFYGTKEGYTKIKSPTELKELSKAGIVDTSKKVDGDYAPLPQGAEIVDTSTTETGGEEQEFEEVTPENRVNPTQVNQIYEEYAGRPATESEIKWHAETHPITKDDLESWAKEAPEVQRAYEKNVTQKQERLNNALEMVDDAVNKGLLSEDQGRMYKRVIKNYPSQSVKTEEILNTFEKIKQETIDPYFKELADVSKEELKRNVQILAQQRELARQQRGLKEKEELRKTKSNLEQRGMTFSGEAKRVLGKKSAYETEKTGALPRQQQLIASSNQLEYEQRLEEMGRQAETKLGQVPDQMFEGVDYQYSPIGVDETATLPYKKSKTSGQALSNLISTSTQSEQNLGNLDVDFSKYNFA